MLRGKLAEEGMLKEDICLGTKATTQRSDTWETKVKPVFYFSWICSLQLRVKSNHGCNFKKWLRLKTKDQDLWNYDSEVSNVSRGVELEHSQ